MGTLTFPGLATGIDTNEIIEQLMAVESRQLARYKVDLEELDEKLTALESIQDASVALQEAAEALSDKDSLIAFTSSSTDDGVVGVSASDDAEAGSHTIIVNQLATSETWIQDDSDFSYTSSLVGEGTFLYSYNYQEIKITTSSTTTLEDFVDLINNDEDNPGVTASLLYQGKKYHLVLTGTETGEDYQISINDTSTEVWKADTALTEDAENADLETELTDLDQWSGFLNGDESITISGTDHNGNAIEPDYTLDITSSTTIDNLIDEINSYFDGVAYAQLKNGKISLTDMTSGTSDLSITLTYNDTDGSGSFSLPTMAVSTEGGATTSNLASMASSTFVQTQDAQNAEIQVDGYTPTATAEVQTITPDSTPSAGTFTLTYNGTTTAAIAYDATATEIQDAINAISGSTGLGNVTVSGTMTGGSIEVTFSTADGNVRPLTVDVSSLTGTSSATVAETERGSNEEWITRNSNTISDAISGITLNLQDVNDLDDSNEPIAVTITVSRDTDSVSEKVESFVSNYNALISLLEEYTEYDNELETMGILSNDVAVSLIETQLKTMLQALATGFTSDDDYQEASDIGIDFDAEGYLELDSSVFTSAIEDNYMSVINLLSATAAGKTDSETIKFSASSELYTEPGTYEVEVEVDAGGNITSAKIRVDGETSYRSMEISDNMISGTMAFDDNGDSIYPENGLFLEVDTSTAGTFTTTVTIREGIFTSLNEILKGISETDGTLDVSITTMEQRLDDLDEDIDDEDARLDAKEESLIQKYARLEAILSDLQNQLSSVSAVL